MPKKGKSYEEMYGIDKAEEIKAKIRASLKGKNTGSKSEAHKANLRANHVGMTGKHHSAETKQKMSTSHKGKILPPFTVEHCANISASLKGKNKGKPKPPFTEAHKANIKIAANRPEVRARKSASQKIAQNRPDVKERRSASMMGKNKDKKKPPRSEEHKANLRKPRSAEGRANIRIAQNRPEVQRKRHISLHKHPNKAELKLSNILQEIHPGYIQFVGYNNSRIIIAELKPDFIFVDGQRKLIEMFGGGWWHKSEEEQERIQRFKEAGWDCLVIWDYELENVEKVSQKLLNFAKK